MSRRLIARLAVLALSAPALAQAPGEVAPRAPAPAPAPKAPSTALALSLGFTAGGAALVLLGSKANRATTIGIGMGLLYLGPSTGHWYAGEIGGTGLALRSAAVLGIGVASVLAAEDCEQARCHGDAIVGLVVASGAAWLGSTIYDIATAPRAARSWNRAHGVAIGPTVVRSAGRSLPGVALGLTF